MAQKQELRKQQKQNQSPSKKQEGLNLENPDIDDEIDDLDLNINDDNDPNVKEYALLMLMGETPSKELCEKIGINCGDTLTNEQIQQGYSQTMRGGMCCVCGDSRCGIGPFFKTQG